MFTKLCMRIAFLLIATLPLDVFGTHTFQTDDIPGLQVASAIPEPALGPKAFTGRDIFQGAFTRLAGFHLNDLDTNRSSGRASIQ